MEPSETEIHSRVNGSGRAAQSDPDASERASEDHEQDPLEQIAAAARGLFGEAAEYAAVQKSLISARIRSVVVAVCLGVLGLLLLAAAISAGMLAVMNGAALGLQAAFDLPAWGAWLLAGGTLLLVICMAAAAGASAVKRSALRDAVARFEERSCRTTRDE